MATIYEDNFGFWEPECKLTSEILRLRTAMGHW
jgi:hypothetical protein